MASVDLIKSFLIEKFWRPITDETVFYNPFNTAVYAALFALAAAYIGKPLMKKLDIDPDMDFYIGIAPFVFLGGAARSLKDADIVNTIALETPFIYIMMFGVVISSLYSARMFETEFDIDYHNIMFSIGVLLSIAVLSLFAYPSIGLLPVTIGIFGIVSAFTYGAAKLLKPELTGFEFMVPIIAHWFDASTSYVALANGASEKHVLANHFINLFGIEGMFIMKALVIIPVVYYIDREIEDLDRRYYLFLIAVLGFALGVRNLISTVAA